MKSTILILSSLLLVVQSSVAQVPVTKSLVKSFNVIGKDVLKVDLGDKVTTQEWTNDYVRVQINIALLNGSETTLKSLIESGRYFIKSVTDEETMKISAPALRRTAIVNGTEINEDISFILFVPSGLSIEKVTATSADNGTNGANITISQ